jgi:hypothetical protein
MWKDSPNMTLCLVLVEGDIVTDASENSGKNVRKFAGMKRTILFTADWDWCETLRRRNGWGYEQLERHLLRRFGLSSV